MTVKFRIPMIREYRNRLDVDVDAGVAVELHRAPKAGAVIQQPHERDIQRRRDALTMTAALIRANVADTRAGGEGRVLEPSPHSVRTQANNIDRGRHAKFR